MSIAGNLYVYYIFCFPTTARIMDTHRFYLVLSVALMHVIGILTDDCNWRYFAHYEQKRCTAVIGTNGCPVRFHCDHLSKEDFERCIHDGQVYEAGESLKNLGPCDSCNCETYKGSAFIECAETDCSQWEAENRSCYMGFYPHECCPVEICPNHAEKNKSCKYESKEYKIGEYIQTSNPCKRCVCTEEWAHEDGPGCHDVHCLIGIHAVKIRKGCLPIYNENGCCLNEMYCDGIYGATPVEVEELNRDNYCYYRGYYYEKESNAYLENDYHQCITCTCTTPPDFTCLKKSCQF